MDTCTGSRNQWNIKARILKMYSRSAKGGEKGDPNRNPWLAKMISTRLVLSIKHIGISIKKIICYFSLNYSKLDHTYWRILGTVPNLLFFSYIFLKFKGHNSKARFNYFFFFKKSIICWPLLKICVSNARRSVPFVVIFIPSIPHSQFILGFVIRLTRRDGNLVKQEPPTIPEHPSLPVFLWRWCCLFFVVFCKYMYLPVFFVFFFWPFYGLSFNWFTAFDYLFDIFRLFLGSQRLPEQRFGCSVDH